MRNRILLCSLLTSCFSYAQIGINTSDPKSSLDITRSALEENKPDGVLIPKISGDDLRAKSDLYTEDQNGVMLYITSADTEPQGKTIDVVIPGFYFYDSGKEKWAYLSGATNVWMTQRKLETDGIRPATNTTEDIFRTGKVAVGFDGIERVSIDGINILKRGSRFNFDLFGNYNIKSGMYNPEDPTKGFWYIDQITGEGLLDGYAKAKSDLKIVSDNIDPIFKGTNFEKQFLSLGIMNKAEGLDFLPSLRLRTHGEWDNAFYPYIINGINPSANLTFKKSSSSTIETPNTFFMRNWDFSSNVMNSLTFGYVEGRFNLQTMRIPEDGEPTGDNSQSYSRIKIERPLNHENDILLENNNIVKDAVKDIFSLKNSLLVDKNGIHFIAKNFDMSYQDKEDGAYYTFPRVSPERNMFLSSGKIETGKLEWSILPMVFNNSYGEVESGLFPTQYSVSSTTDFQLVDRLFNIGNGQSESLRSDALTILKNGVASLPSIDNNKIDDASSKVIITKEYLDIRVPKPPTSGKYTLVSDNGVVSWEIIP